MAFSFSLFWASILGCKGQANSFDAKLDEVLSYTVDTISAEDLHQKKDSFLILDAREEDEFNISHIPGAIRVGYKKFDDSQIQGWIQSKKPIVVYCSIGYRSERIGEKIQEQGGKEVYNLRGGIFSWSNAEYPLTDSLGPTNKVHAYNEDWSVWLKKGEKVY
ncbi:MAG: rhodanese-related sulfurtransferase [Sphingobacteriales bacterium]|jgi:rhodanese-related sulfurtransferase